MSNQFASGITNERQWQGMTEEETGRARGVHGDMRTSEATMLCAMWFNVIRQKIRIYSLIVP